MAMLEKSKIQNKFSPSPYTIISDFKIRKTNELIHETEQYFMFLKKSLNLDKNLTFGLELEFEDADFNQVNKELSKTVETLKIYSWKLIADISVTKENEFNEIKGGEIVSPILSDAFSTWNDLDKVCKMLLRLKATAENNCGGHIHFGAHIIGDEKKYWLNLLKLWTIYEKIIFRFAYGDKDKPRRDINRYAKPVANDFIDIIPQIKNMDFDLNNLNNIINQNINQAINFHNVYSFDFKRDNTIEIRCPNMSLNPVIWQNNVNFFANMFLYCKSNSFDYNFIDYKLSKYNKKECNLKNYQKLHYKEALELCDLIFDKKEDKIYFLKQYLKCFDKEKKRPLKV